MSITRLAAWASATLLTIVAVGCGVDETGIDPPKDSLYYPIGLAADPDGRYLYVANSVFDRKYNAGTLAVFDTWTRQLLPEQTQRIKLFAGEMVLARFTDGVVGDASDACDVAADGEQSLGRPVGTYGFVVTREGDELVRFKAENGTIECDAKDSDGRCVTTALVEPSSTVREDPYSIALDGSGLYIGHIGRGAVSRWGFDGTALGYGFKCALNLQGGASAVAKHPVLGWVYATDRFGNKLTVVEELPSLRCPVPGAASAESCQLRTQRSITVDVNPSRGRTRGLAFSADGSLLYVASSTDGTLRVYDTSVSGAGTPRNRLLAAIPVGDGPNMVRVAGLRPGETRPEDGLDGGMVRDVVDRKGGGLVYVSTFDDDRLMVIDPMTLSVVGRIELGDGPHDVEFMPDKAGRLVAYVTNFEAHALSVVDLEPGSATRFQHLATVP